LLYQVKNVHEIVELSVDVAADGELLAVRHVDVDQGGLGLEVLLNVDENLKREPNNGGSISCDHYFLQFRPLFGAKNSAIVFKTEVLIFCAKSFILPIQTPFLNK
jgi:hypothetical protein